MTMSTLPQFLPFHRAATFNVPLVLTRVFAMTVSASIPRTNAARNGRKPGPGSWKDPRPVRPASKQTKMAMINQQDALKISRRFFIPQAIFGLSPMHTTSIDKLIDDEYNKPSCRKMQGMIKLTRMTESPAVPYEFPTVLYISPTAYRWAQ